MLKWVFKNNYSRKYGFIGKGVEKASQGQGVGRTASQGENASLGCTGRKVNWEGRILLVPLLLFSHLLKIQAKPPFLKNSFLFTSVLHTHVCTIGQCLFSFFAVFFLPCKGATQRSHECSIPSLCVVPDLAVHQHH